MRSETAVFQHNMTKGAHGSFSGGVKEEQKKEDNYQLKERLVRCEMLSAVNLIFPRYYFAFQKHYLKPGLCSSV